MENEEKLNLDFLESICFSELIDVCEKAQSGSELKEKVLELIEKKADSFDQWLLLYCHAPINSNQRIKALERMKEIGSVDQWLSVHKFTENGSDLQKVALIKIAEFAKS